MCGLLHLVQRGEDWEAPQPAHAPSRCTKYRNTQSRASVPIFCSITVNCCGHLYVNKTLIGGNTKKIYGFNVHRKKRKNYIITLNPNSSSLRVTTTCNRKRGATVELAAETIISARHSRQLWCDRQITERTDGCFHRVQSLCVLV